MAICPDSWIFRKSPERTSTVHYQQLLSSCQKQNHASKRHNMPRIVHQSSDALVGPPSSKVCWSDVSILQPIPLSQHYFPFFCFSSFSIHATRSCIQEPKSRVLSLCVSWMSYNPVPLSITYCTSCRGNCSDCIPSAFLLDVPHDFHYRIVIRLFLFFLATSCIPDGVSIAGGSTMSP